MGQSSSAVSASREVRGDDGGDPLCGGAAGCLSVPRFLRRREAVVLVFEEYEVLDEPELLTVTGGGADPPPEDLVLTDVEDHDDGDGDASDNVGEESQRTPNGGEWLPDYVASHCALPPADDAPPPDPAAVPAAAEHGRRERAGRDAAAIPAEALARLVAVDCGLVHVRGAGAHRTQALRRVGVVDGRGAPLLGALVRVDAGLLAPPARRVNGYGDHLDVGVPAAEIRAEVAGLLRGKVVVGHQVEGDLAALGLGRRSSAQEREAGRGFEVRDTAGYPPFRGRDGQSARKLRDLVKEKLERDIQPSGQFHCCEEDAIAALDLYKSVWHEWEAASITANAIIKQSKERHQAQRPSQGQWSRKKPKKRKEKKKQKRKAEKKERKLLMKINQKSHLNKPQAKQHLCYLSSARRLLVSAKALFVAPTLFSVGPMRGTARPVTAPAAPNQRRRKGKKKKTPRRPRPWPTKQHCDSALLLFHCLLEARCIVLSPWNVHSANGALTAGLVGMALLGRGGRRHDAGAGALYGVLTQYRLVSALARMAGYRGFAVVMTPTPAARERVLARVTFELVQSNHGRATARESAGVFLGQLLPFVHSDGAPSQDFILLCCDVVLACWFVLRSSRTL